ncbi:MG2 domain-containing protein [Kiritimatiellota bacterium B12222]|nr:MG2 domain-containing protein [Kiritimatiellota bacterium B12222]
MSSSVRRVCIVSLFFVLNAFGLWQGLRIWEAHLQGIQRRDPVLVETFPKGKTLLGREKVTWLWDQDVVTPEMVGKVLSDPPVGLNPPMLGEFEWTSERHLSFSPLEDWPVAREMVMEVQTLTTNAHHQVFSLNEVTTLEGPALDVVAANAYHEEGSGDLEVRVQLNTAVDIDVLRTYLQILTPNENERTFSIEPTPYADEFLVTTSWLREEALTVVFREGLYSVHGPQGGLKQDRSYTFKNIRTFTLNGVEVKQPTFGSGEIQLHFSDIPSLQSVRDSLQIEPNVQFSVGKSQWWRRQSCSIRGDFVPGTTYRITLLEGMESIQGRRLKHEVSRELMMPLRSPGLKFAHEGWILNAKGASKIEVLTENEGALDVSLYRVHASNLVDYALRASGSDNGYSASKPEHKLGRVVYAKRLEEIESGSVFVDLSESLAQSGQGVYRLQIRGRNSKQSIDRIVALSDTGLLARQTGDQLWVWALSLDTASGVPEMEVSLWSETRQFLAKGKTDADGVLTLEWLDEEEKGAPRVLMGQKGDSFALLSLVSSQAFPGKNGTRPYLLSGNEAFVYTARGMYRPGEIVNARAIVRGPGFSLPGEFPVQWKLINSAGLIVWESQQNLSDLGTVSSEIQLQPEWPNGRYELCISLPGEDAARWGKTAFYLESFVPPQVVVSAETPHGERSVPEDFVVNIHARMLYGGAAAQHQGKAVLTLQSELFRSSEYPEHVFSDSRKPAFAEWTRPLREFKTNEEGHVSLHVKVPQDKRGPSTLRAVVGVSVTEFSGREASTFLSRRVDRIPYYVGMTLVAEKEDLLSVNVVSVDAEGKKFDGDTELEMAWYRVNRQSGYRRDAKGRYTWFSEDVDVLEGTRKVSLFSGEGAFQLPVVAAGSYRVAFRDLQTGFSCSDTVSVGEYSQRPERADRVVLELDKARYDLGEEATVRVTAPFAGNLLLSLEGAEGLWVRSVEMQDKSQLLTFKVPDVPASNLWLRATVVRSQPVKGVLPVVRSDGVVAMHLNQDTFLHPLSIEVEDQLRPSETVSLALQGEPGAEVVVVGVDEGILLLDDFQTPDPFQWFMALRRAISLQWDSFDDLMPELGAQFFAGNSKMGGGMGSALRKRLNPVDAKRFKPLSWWSGNKRFSEEGRLTVHMDMPEFSGQVRWMAVQVSPQGMGSAEAKSRVGREVIVQQSLPLFLSPGDETQWLFRLHNRSDDSKSITLLPTVKGPLSVHSEGRVLKLEPGEVVQLSWTVKALAEVGKAEATMGIRVDNEFWQDSIELAVRPSESFEVHSKRQLLAPGEQMRVMPQMDMYKGTSLRSLQVSAMPTLQLEGARMYLLRYPYGCVEQTVSAASVALYMPEWSSDATDSAEEIVNAGLIELWKKQRRDGGFGYWTHRDTLSVPGSFAALNFMIEAQDQGYQVDERSLRRAIEWARGYLLSAAWENQEGGSNLSIAQACNVLAKAGELDAGWLQRLRERKESLGSYGKVMAAQAMWASGRGTTALEMLDGVSQVSFGVGWRSETTGNAELLWLLLQVNPQDARIYPLVELLLSKRNAQGRWAHTYENASVIKAFTAYEKAWPVEEGDFNVLWQTKEGTILHLNNKEKVSLAPVTEGLIRNTGAKVVYVEIRNEGMPLQPAAVQNTFKVDRQLLRLNGEVVKKGEVLTSGEMLMLRLKVSDLPHRVKNLVIDQPLPAGIEALASSQQVKAWTHMQKGVREKVSTARHLEVRDDRLLLFPHEISSASRVYYIRVRAVSPGRYTFPALWGQDMYDDGVVYRGEPSLLEVKR